MMELEVWLMMWGTSQDPPAFSRTRVSLRFRVRVAAARLILVSSFPPTFLLTPKLHQRRRCTMECSLVPQDPPAPGNLDLVVRLCGSSSAGSGSTSHISSHDYGIISVGSEIQPSPYLAQ